MSLESALFLEFIVVFHFLASWLDALGVISEKAPWLSDWLRAQLAPGSAPLAACLRELVEVRNEAVMVDTSGLASWAEALEGGCPGALRSRRGGLRRG